MVLSRPFTLALPTFFICSVVLAASFVTSVRAEDINTKGFGSQPTHIATLPADSKALSGAETAHAHATPTVAVANNPLSSQSTEANKTAAPKLNHASRNIRFVQQPGHIQLDARQATWPQLLETIEQHTGARFHYASLPVYPVSLSLKGRTAQEMLTQLFGSATGYACRFSKNERQSVSSWPEEIWVGEIIDTDLRHSQDKNPLEVNAPVKQPVQQSPQASPQTEIARIQALLVQANSADLSERTGALTDLSTLDNSQIYNPEVQAALQAGLKEGDEGIRGQIIYSLISRGGEQALDLLNTALNDPSAGVRMVAMQAADISQAQTLELIKQGLNDTDANVRQAAQDRLKAAGLTDETL